MGYYLHFSPSNRSYNGSHKQKLLSLKWICMSIWQSPFTLYSTDSVDSDIVSHFSHFFKKRTIFAHRVHLQKNWKKLGKSFEEIRNNFFLHILVKILCNLQGNFKKLEENLWKIRWNFKDILGNLRRNFWKNSGKTLKKLLGILKKY